MLNEILFCSTTDTTKARSFVKGLEKQEISYLQRWEEISVFKRKKYGNAKEICNIYVNPGQIEMVEAYYAGLTDEEKKDLSGKKNKKIGQRMERSGIIEH